MICPNCEERLCILKAVENGHTGYVGIKTVRYNAYLRKRNITFLCSECNFDMTKEVVDDKRIVKEYMESRRKVLLEKQLTNIKQTI